MRVLAQRGYRVTAFRVLRPAGRGPLTLAASTTPEPGFGAADVVPGAETRRADRPGDSEIRDPGGPAETETRDPDSLAASETPQAGRFAANETGHSGVVLTGIHTAETATEGGGFRPKARRNEESGTGRYDEGGSHGNPSGHGAAATERVAGTTIVAVDHTAETATATVDSTPNTPLEDELVVELYGANQRSRGALQALRRWLTIRSGEYPALFTSMRRAVEHRALMGIAIGDLGLGSNKPLTVAALDRGWMLYAHTVPAGTPLSEVHRGRLAEVWRALDTMHQAQVSHGELRADDIRITDGGVLFGGFTQSEFGAYDARFESDVAQLLLTSAALYGAETAVRTAIEVLGKQRVLTASRRLTKIAIPVQVRGSVPGVKEVMKSIRDEVVRQTGQDRIEAAQITRYSRNQIIQLVLLIGLVYVAYPYISAVPTFTSELSNANWWWALLGLVVSVLKYIGAAMALWACAGAAVNLRNLMLMQVANTFAATTTPAGVGGLALSVRFLQKSGLGAVRATAAVAMQQSVQVGTHVVLLIFFSVAAGISADLSHMFPDATVLYLVGGVLLGLLGVSIFLPTVRRWLRTEVRPQLAEVLTQLKELGRSPLRLVMIIGGCAATTLGAALALWTSIEAFGGSTTFVTVTVVTMIGGTLAAAAPTPGGVGAVEAALIGGLAAFGVPASIAVPSVLLYRVLTCWLPVFIGWPIMRWLTRNDMI
ncbi:flippase-like domain-containing protein [Nocardia uniformis]|uniref:Flippase-like domain-containing protein n=1 Tax=Nocardia uniformis TaxID=53432 RepID=A0A849CJF8_9NOCA|nr:flippase-like domain-containing protein [Nocardia uniformis]